jgi:hypothetical protein
VSASLPPGAGEAGEFPISVIAKEIDISPVRAAFDLYKAVMLMRVIIGTYGSIEAALIAPSWPDFESVTSSP